MNNPYFYSIPTSFVQPKMGLLGRLFGTTGISIGNFLNGTQRILNIANQTIPLVKQIRPMIGNAKTMFKVMNEFKKNDKQNNFQNTIEEQKIDTSIVESQKSGSNDYIVQEDNGPNFFL